MYKQICWKSQSWMVIFSIYVGCSIHLSAAAPLPEVPIAIEDGKLTARIDQLPLQAVLDKLQQLTGMRYVLPPAVAERTISARVQALPLVKGLREIFASLSYSIRTDADGKVLSVVILERYDGVPQMAESPRASETVEPMLITLAQGAEMSVIFPPTAEPMPIVLSSEERMPMTLPRTPIPMPTEPARESMGMPLAR
jgi:type II secretory pathway component GspD/PulD (secretin)